MGKCDDCMHGRTCGFRDDWTEECYNYGKEETKMDKRALGRRLRELRGIDRTQDEVADAVGISRAILSKYENGQTIPGGDIVVKLAGFYGVSTDYIFLGSDTKHNE